ncbi:MAG: Fe-S cluster assembly ATPase SufC [Coriobacteriia bacterium]|nr:Fe-S cluster assembly ATPase SufC [Coriobacteriia bacterium]
MGELLKIRGLCAGAGDKPILHDVDLTVGAGETHVLMGPNGAGKSTLGQVIMGDPEYTVTAGSIGLAGEDITEKAVDYRSRAGLFMSFQAPVEVPGVPLNSFLRAIVAQHEELKLKGKRYKKRVAEIMQQLDMDEKYLNRELNVGFSGGEKKKVEMLQLLLLQPKLAILDETDSGLDVDALAIVSRAISMYRESCDGSLIIITHQKRLLEHFDVDRTHIMVNGRLVETGDASLVDDINENGFERFIKAAPAASAPAESEGDSAPAHFDVAAALEHMEEALAAADAAALKDTGHPLDALSADQKPGA